MKTMPTGIRIKPDKLNFIKEKENLETIQQVVTFLVDKYWWENKLPVIKDITPVNKGNVTKSDKPVLSQYDAYALEISNAEEIWELEQTIKEVLKDKGLTLKEKSDLDGMTKSRAKEIM